MKTVINLFTPICIATILLSAMVGCSTEDSVEEASSSFTPVITPLDNGIPKGMVLIPAGEFEMGSDDAVAFPDEQPVHAVYVDAFYMDKYEVTNLEYQKFVRDNPNWQKEHIESRFHDGRYLEDWNGNNHPKGRSNHPVTSVSWYAAMAYAQWAEKRLPTEAEWEYAARGGLADRRYPWGNKIDPKHANYNKSVGDTTPVGKYSANGYGLYDMAGNVWEWCLDAFDADFYSVSPRENPFSGVNDMEWVIGNFTEINSACLTRGGSWSLLVQDVRVSIRNRKSPNKAITTTGFRCAKSVTP